MIILTISIASRLALSNPYEILCQENIKPNSFQESDASAPLNNALNIATYSNFSIQLGNERSVGDTHSPISNISSHKDQTGTPLQSERMTTAIVAHSEVCTLKEQVLP